MKKRFFAVICALLLAFTATSVRANEVSASGLNGVYGGPKLIGSYQTVWPSLHRYFMAYKTQSTIGGGLFLGYDFHAQYSVPIRAELEYAIRSDVQFSDSAASGNDSVNAKATWGLQTIFANVYFDFHNTSNFTPYVGAGIGTGIITSDYKLRGELAGDAFNYKSKKTNAVLAGNLGLGVAYLINENVSADVGYRSVFIDDNEVRFAGVKINTLGSAHELMFGLRFTY